MLIGNYTVRNKSPGRFLGGGSAASGAETKARANFNGTARRSVHYGDGESTANKLWGQPTGGYGDISWMFPYQPGFIASYDEAQGVATASATIIEGRPIAGTSDGVGSVTGTAQLVVSGFGASDGVATVTGNVYAALSGVGESAGVATAAGAIQALAWGVGSADGIATVSAVRYATGAMAGSIAPAVDLEASSFSTYLLDEEDIETGLTLRKALRLIAAATGGKASGLSGSTAVYRSAVADTKDRITATVDADGNRTLISYDLDD